MPVARAERDPDPDPDPAGEYFFGNDYILCLIYHSFWLRK
jgi:hypothetical protein